MCEFGLRAVVASADFFGFFVDSALYKSAGSSVFCEYLRENKIISKPFYPVNQGPTVDGFLYKKSCIKKVYVKSPV